MTGQPNNIALAFPSTCQPTVFRRTGSHRRGHENDVPVRTIDSLFAEWGSSLGFAHLDVEGSEQAAIGGMREVLRRDRPVLSVEVHAGDRKTAPPLLELLLAQFGPGEIAVEADEVLLGDVQRARDYRRVPRAEMELQP